MTDYKNAHIAWLKATRDFICKYPDDYSIPYIDVMAALYADERVPQSMAEAMFVSDKAWYRKSKKIAKQIDQKVLALDPSYGNAWFITFGYDHTKWSIPKVINIINRVMQLKWITKCKAQFELHRENGEHPHTHFLIYTDFKFGDIKYGLTRPKYIKELVTQDNFIDIKKAEQVHFDYINLIKQEKKMPYVEKDNKWREENNIPVFEKNW